MKKFLKTILTLSLCVLSLSCNEEESADDKLAELNGKKIITIGDSLTALCGWQPYLVEWLGVDWSREETVNGVNGHSPMAKGGTWVKPSYESSIYIRSLDAKYYDPDIIFVYVASNDPMYAWASPENAGKTPEEIAKAEPAYRGTETDASVSTTSAYKGMIENLMRDCPDADIYLIGMMRIYIKTGMVPTADFTELWGDTIRFENMQEVEHYEMTERYPRLEIIREIGKMYDLPVIDLWTMSGITNENAHEYYGEVAGDCTQVHPNAAGDKRVAECIRDFLLSE